MGTIIRPPFSDSLPLHQRRAQSGFSLLEVLVAFSILALSLGTLMQIFSGAMRNAVLSEQYSRAALLAQSRLSAVGIEEALREGAAAGESADGMQWRTTVTAYEEPLPEGEGAGARSPALGLVEGYHVRVEVSWRDGEKRRRVELESLRIASDEP